MEAATISAVAALTGVVVGAVLGPWANARIARRDRIQARFDDAIAKVRVVQARRHFPTSVPSGYLDPEGVAGGEVDEFNLAQRKDSVAEFYRAMRDARTALALVEGSDPAIKTALSDWEITEATAETLVGVLERSRKQLRH
jgi:hypothetical protein